MNNLSNLSNLQKSKEELRTDISRERRYLTPEKKTILDKKIFTKLTNLPVWKNAKTVLIYVSHKDEIATLDFIKKTLNANSKKRIIVVPKTHLKFHALSLHKLDELKQLIPGNYGILEPHHLCETILPEQIDLAIIPGIVFNKKGHRIGYGKGYYDRLIPHLNCPKISLAYNLQIVENMPVEDHDQLIDILLTESKKYDFNS